MSHETGKAKLAIAVVIATKDREKELANRALRSVVAQTRAPDFLVVVDDSHPRHREANRRIVDAVATRVGQRVKYMVNSRTPGASGAWNDGLDWLHRQVADPDSLLVAVLDDDDAWEPTYLERCARAVSDGALDMVAADIRRHEGAREASTPQPAPERLDAREFLVGNPGIQGSNLCARLGTFLAAGLFDEALTSCTDRDLCIRIADLGFIRYARLPEALVHHHADGNRPRLSSPRSAAKLDGLTAFWRKYHRRMTGAERAAFIVRANTLFGWDPPASPDMSAPRTVVHVRPHVPINLVVGITTQSQPAPAFEALLADLAAMRADPRMGQLDVIVLENGPRGADGGARLSRVVGALRDQGIGSVLVPLERQSDDAAAGAFGSAFERGGDRVTIDVARTMLQTYVYLWSRHRPGAIAWILDDDMHLDNLVWTGGGSLELGGVDFLGTLARLRDAGVDIALGTNTGAPPVPFASCVRTQLVDAVHNLHLLANLKPDDEFPELLPETMALRKEFADYYYDLSRRETDHLETPFGYVPRRPGQHARDVLREMVGRIARILAGEQVFRPLVHDASIDPLEERTLSVHRGGNTFIIALDALRDFRNSVPTIGGQTTRRSDMVWSLMNKYVAARNVVKVPLPVRQDRDDVPVQHLDLDKLVRDIHGFAIYSALEDIWLRRREDLREAGAGKSMDDLQLTDGELDLCVARFRKYVDERLYNFQLSFHRAAGLARSLERFLDRRLGWWWTEGDEDRDACDALAAAIHLLREEYDPRRLAELCARVRDVDDRVIRVWLAGLRDEVDARPGAVEDAEARAWIVEQRVDNAELVVERTFGVHGLRVLGVGSEGVVFTDEKRVFKCIDTGRLDRDRIAFLRAQVGRWSGLRSLYDLLDVRTSGAHVILTYRFERTLPYRGGHGGGLRQLLDDVREAGIVCANIKADNLVVTPAGDVKVIDYGSDTWPFSARDWILMARKVWLTGRFADRADLKRLMSLSLDDADLPELDGLDAFLRADPRATKRTLVDDNLERRVMAVAPATVFDYGCGTGRLATRLASRGISVDAYDPDPTLAPRWRALDSAARFRSSTDVEEILASGRAYDAVVCSLVICVIDDDQEVCRVLGRLAGLAGPGRDVFLVVCNPDHVTRSTLLQHRERPANPDVKSITWKTVRSTGSRRRDVHRPLVVLLRLAAESGLRLISREDTASIDPDTLEPSSDFLILHFRREGTRP